MPGRHRDGRRKSLLPWLIGVAVLVIVAAVTVALVLHQSPDTTNKAGTTASSSPTPSPSGTPSQSSTPTPTPTRSVTQARTVQPEPAASPTRSTVRHTMVLRWTQRSWVRVISSSGNVVINGSRKAGTVLTFDGSRYTVRIGNAGGVLVSRNGGAAAAAGPVGQIAAFTVTRT